MDTLRGLVPMTRRTITVDLAPIGNDPKRREYVVTLDGEIVLRTGGKSVPDYGQAQSFAQGLALGLKLGGDA